MNLLFASDIHGSALYAERALKLADQHQVDRIVLLGDLLYHGPRNPLPEGHDPQRVAQLLNQHKQKIVSVRGNCDAEVDQMLLEFPCLADFALIEDDRASFYLTHGHLHGPQNLPPLCASAERPCVFASGHTHVKQLEMSGDVVLLNPGSTSLPKDGCRSVALYREGVLSLIDLESGDVLKELVL